MDLERGMVVGLNERRLGRLVADDGKTTGPVKPTKVCRIASLNTHVQLQ